MSPGRLQALVDAEVAAFQEQVAWEFRLSINELWWGSAYGPWPPMQLEGLRTIVER